MRCPSLVHASVCVRGRTCLEPLSHLIAVNTEQAVLVVGRTYVVAQRRKLVTSFESIVVCRILIWLRNVATGIVPLFWSSR